MTIGRQYKTIGRKCKTIGRKYGTIGRKYKTIGRKYGMIGDDRIIKKMVPWTDANAAFKRSFSW